MSKRTSNRGFTIVEVLIAIVILAVGMLALATTSIFATTQVKVADLKTEQSLAVQQVVERLYAMPYANLASVAEERAERIGSYDVWWSVTPETRFHSRVLVFTKGPGYRMGWVPEARDTFVVEIAEIP